MTRLSLLSSRIEAQGRLRDLSGSHLRPCQWRPVVALLLLFLAGYGPLAGQPERVGPSWSERQKKIEKLLDEGDWKAARKQASRLSDDIVANAWRQPGIGRRLAKIGRYLAVAEINLGMEREAVWHWLAAWNLYPPEDRDAIAARGHTGVLLETTLRRLGDMPPGYQLLGDLEQLRLEPAKLPTPDRPVLANDAASRGGPVPDLLVEVLIDRTGVLRHPVIDDSGVSPVGTWATLRWLLTFPPARPAVLDGEPVDTLQLLTIEFGR